MCLVISIGAFAQKSEIPKTSNVITCTDFHITKPLRELAEEKPYVQTKFRKPTESGDRKHRTPQHFEFSVEDGSEYGNDESTMQSKMGEYSPSTKAPIKNWPGLTAAGFRPSDPTGAAGPNHYIQAINGTPFRVYDKSTGAALQTMNIGALWSTPTPNDGDPIVMYDRYADRWFISQFGTSGNKIYIAISQTSDPLGSYYTYTFTSPEFPDYLKFSIWADGYYMTSNQGTDKVYCFERDQMLLGNPSARAVYSNYTTGPVSGFFVPLPADADGGLPTVGTPCSFFSYSDNAWGGGAVDGVKIWNMAVTWGATPAATITLVTTVPTAAFDASYDASWNDIIQPGTSQKLDGIGGVPTYRAQWRKWSGYNSVLLTWGVKISATQRSIKWVELRQNQSTGTWTLYQEGTYTPDAHSRWLSSIAMDDNGSIALCYAKSSSSVYPSLCYTGRVAGDPLGQMSFAETVAIAGTSSETSGNRYGDYSQTSLDPDGLTFWHTGEYTASGTKTRVYSFQLQLPNVPPVANFAADNTTPCIGSTVTLNDQSTGIPTSWAWTITPSSYTYVGGTNASSQNPQVQFSAAGPYTVTLVATNAYGNDSEVKTSYITPQSGAALPLVENFEGATFPPTGWTLENNDAPSVVWGTEGVKGFERRAAAGNTGSTAGCAGINCFNYSTQSTTDNLITFPVSLVGAASPELTFKRAYKYYNNASYYDILRVYVSTDCGTTFSEVYMKGGTTLATSGTSNSGFTPSVAADWDKDTIDMAPYVGQTVIIKFEVTNMYGNNLYIDDINLDNTAAAVASVSIASSDADNTICAGTSVTFTATPTNGGTAPSYQWQVNGVNVGTNSPTYVTSTLTTGQSVTCIMTSNLPGVLGSPATSNAIVTTVNAIPSTTAGSNSPVCSGSAINLTATAVAGGTYAWTGPNSYTSTSQNPTIASATTAMTGTYSVVVTANGCSSSASNTSVTVNATVTPSISIVASSNPVCIGESVTFTATPVNGGASPSYQWKKNGVNVGTNSSVFTTSTISNGDVFTCVLTSNANCASPTTATSNSITMTINTSIVPSVSIAASSNPACSGSSVTFTATPTNGGTTPSYQWKLNGVNVGTNSATYVNASISNGDVVTCVMTSSSSCASPASATSNSITMTVTSPVTPSVSIALTSGSNPTCSGTSVTFTATPTNGGSTPSYQWKVNGVNAGTNAATFTTSSLSNGDVVTCVMTSSNTCVTASTGTSNAITMSITTSVTPTISISGSNSGAAICDGTNVDFSASITNGGSTPAYQWKVNGSNVGTNSAVYSNTALANGDVVTCVLTSNATCTTQSSVTSSGITMVVNPVVTPSNSIAITNGSNPICEGSSVTFTSTPVNGGATPSYQWQVNGANAGTNTSTFTTSTLVNNDVVTCVLTSNAACTTTPTATSSAITMTVNPLPSTPTITANGTTLTSSAATGNQWYLNGLIITGATNQTYVATQNGNYTVVVTEGNCGSESAITTIGDISIEDVTNTGTHFFIYPNPSNGVFNLVFTSTDIMKYTVRIHNTAGQLIFEEELNDFNGSYIKYFDITSYGKGEYFLSISNELNERIEKVITY